MKRLLKFFSVMFCICIFNTAYAATFNGNVAYKEDFTRSTGTNWGFVGYKVDYEVSDPEIAEIIKDKNGNPMVHLIKPGDVVIKVTFYSGGKKLDPEYYHFHVTGTAVDDTAFDWGHFAIDVIRLTNEERKKAGLPSLKPAFDLSDEAATRAREITEVFSHTRPDRTSFSTVFDEGSYKAVGENLQAGASTPERVVKEWMASQSHRENILSDEYDELGVGYIYLPNSKYKHYWVQLFRKQ